MSLSDEELKKKLTPEQYQITRQKGTERPFTGEYNAFKGNAVFKCVCCNAELFTTNEKFDSGSGWPSFWKPSAADNVELHPDSSHGMYRTEVTCKQCGSHLGHVFEDGPAPTGQRYCINSLSLQHEDC